MNNGHSIITIGEAMTNRLYTIEEGQNIFELVELFGKKEVHHLVVLAGGELKGIVSKTDLANKLLDLSLNTSGNAFSKLMLKGTTVGEIMTTNPLTLRYDEPLGLAVEVLNKGIFHAIPIMNDEGVVGIITATDIMEYYYKQKVLG